MRNIVQRTLFLMIGLLMIVALPASAQSLSKFSVISFELDPLDVSAQNAEYEKIDGSGSRYAIIKVTSDTPDAHLNAYLFNFGMLKSFSEMHGKALWIYVQKNAKHVTISREGYETIEKYDLRTTIQAGHTYRMVLSSGAPVVRQQMVLFEIAPKGIGAMVMVAPERGAEKVFGSQDETGAAAESLPLGTYTYRVMAKMYQTSEGRFTLNDRNQTHQEKVVLTPHFSTVTLQVPGEADIYVNGIRKGTQSWTGKLEPGNYQVECRQAHHRSSTQSISVNQVNRTLTFDITPPTPILGTLSVTSNPLGADILIDGVKQGVTPRNMDVMEGAHQLTLRKHQYKPAQQKIEIVENQIKKVRMDLKKTKNAQSVVAKNINVEEDGLWVDLGLSVLWASHNVGANYPEEYGDYFAWGEIKPKEKYMEENSKMYRKSMKDISGNPQYDAATIKWGTSARMPTDKEIQELIDYTITQWTIRNGVGGRLVTSKKNGKSIFLPATGYRNGTSFDDVGEDGYYWCSTPNKNNDDGACDLYFSRGNFDSYWSSRNYGFSIRPVRSK